MGIKRLNNFLQSKDLLIHHNNINNFIRGYKNKEYQFFNTRNKTFVIGVDLLLYAHKYKYSCNDIIYGFINQLLNFLSNKIIPVYVIDGIAPVEKENIILSRQKKRENIDLMVSKLEMKLYDENISDIEKINIKNQIKKYNKSNIKITSYDLNNLIEIFKQLNVPYIRAKGEADTLIAKLYKESKIDACLSEDMDLLVFGCGRMIKFKSNRVIEYNLNHIINNLEINKIEFIELCILFGCDYLKSILKIKPDEIYYRYINCTNIREIFIGYDKDVVEEYLLEFKKIRDIFINVGNNENTKIDFHIKKINKNNILKILDANKCNVSEKNLNNIKYTVSYVNNLIKNKTFDI